MIAGLPGIVFTGSMLGINRGYTAPMGEIIAGLLQKDGYPITVTSRKLNRAARLADILSTLLLSQRTARLQVLQVYSGMSFIMEDLASLLAKRLGYRIILHFHGGAIPQFIDRHPNWTRRVFRRADRIITPTNYLARCLMQLGYSVDVIPNVIDLSLYPYRVREQIRPNLLWMRAFHPVYNPEMAVDVFSLVYSKYPEATLVMAGQEKGSLEGIKARARQVGVLGRIQFPGYLQLDEKMAAFNRSDIFTNTNRIDNTPVSLLEACACGLPVITTNVGGIPDLVEDQFNALLVENEQSGQMAGRVFELMDNPAQVKRLSENGRKLAQTCDWQVVGPRWRRLLAEVASS